APGGGAQQFSLLSAGTTATTTTVSSSTSASAFGQAVTFTATVSADGATPDGSVTFVIDGVEQTPVTLDPAAQAKLTTASLAAANHTGTAKSSGSETYADSASDPLTQVVNPAATTTTIVSSQAHSTYGDLLTISATVSTVSPGVGI